MTDQEATPALSITPLDILETIRRFYTQQRRWPTVSEVVAQYHRKQAEMVKAKIRSVLQMGWADEVEVNGVGRVLQVVTDLVPAGPVVTYRLSPEEIAERYGPPKRSKAEADKMRQVAEHRVARFGTSVGCDTESIQAELEKAAATWQDRKSEASQPAAEQEVQETMRPPVSKRPSDVEFIAEFERSIADPNDSPTAMANRYGLSYKGLMSAITRSRLRVKAEERTGLKLTHDGNQNPPAPPASEAPAATADQRQGVDSPAQDGAATSVTATQDGMLMDVPQAAVTMTVDLTKAPGYAAAAVIPIPTTPTAEQLPAIVADLEGHPPTQGEVEELFAEAGAEKPDAQRVAELTQAVAHLRQHIADQDAELHRLRYQNIALDSAAEQAIADAHRPMLLLKDGETLREVAVAPENLPKPGDNIPEVLTVDGVQQVNVLRCTAAGTTATGNPVRVMVLVYTTAEGEAA